jgi:restriction system protein
VKWLRTDIPRNAFRQDLLYSFGALTTVCQISRNNAEERVRMVLSGKPDPGPGIEPPEDETADAEGLLDLEGYARDQIMTYIGREFRGHALARLVNELLLAQGYRSQLSPPGADGGTDIIAGAGPMGFDEPRLCVQVKSSDAPVDVGVLRELQGVMRNFGAQQGLLVSWGGWKSSVMAEARRLFFEIRLWDAGDLVKALLQNYERLSPEVQAELPLKRIWALVPEEDEASE